MPKYIKSHSNYRLSTKHQNVNGGKILERDITTIGGISPFAMGQTTIHSSGNFIIAINDSTGPSRHIRKDGWVNNDMSGSTWTYDVLTNQASDVNGSLERNIVLKNDYMDFRTFACYGSLADLVQNSVGDILERFPYEVYTDEGNGEYKVFNIEGSLDATELTYEGEVSGRGSKTIGIESEPVVINLGDDITPSEMNRTGADDTTSIQSILEKLSPESVLYIPNGKYYASNLDVRCKNIKIIGQSRSGVKFYPVNNNSPVFKVSKNGVTISDMTFYGSGNTAIECSSSYCTFHDISTYGVGKAIDIKSGEDYQKSNVCYNIYCANGEYGVYASSQEGCKIYAVKGENISGSTVYVSGGTDVKIANVSISNSTKSNSKALELKNINSGSTKNLLSVGSGLLDADSVRQFEFSDILSLSNSTCSHAIRIKDYEADFENVFCFSGKTNIQTISGSVANFENVRLESDYFVDESGISAILDVNNSQQQTFDGLQINNSGLTQGYKAIDIDSNSTGAIYNCGVGEGRDPLNTLISNGSEDFDFAYEDLIPYSATPYSQCEVMGHILAENDADINKAIESMTTDETIQQMVNEATRGYKKVSFDVSNGHGGSDDEDESETEEIVNMYVKSPASASIRLYSGTTGQNAEYVEGEEKWYVISNPGNINLHAVNVEECENADPLKYFANGGYLNYGLFFDHFDPTPDDGYPFEWTSQLNCYTAIDNGNNSISINFDLREDPRYFSVYFNEDMSFEGIVDANLGNYLIKNGTISAKKGETYYFRAYEENGTIEYEALDRYCPQVGDFVAKITITPQNCIVWNGIGRENDPIILRAYRDDKLNVIYLVREKDFRIHFRPKQSLSFYDNFKDSLNMFQRTILGDFSGVKNTARFEVMNEGEYGYTKKLQTFTFPTNHGGWNPGSDGLDMVDYVRTLMNIGLVYDEKFSDNICRSMTHEALKNLDWTRGFNDAEERDDNNHYIQTGDKFKSIIRIMGFFFDQEKAYIDCIGNTNTLTYNNRANLSDYFISDKLEMDGWVVNNISTYSLYEYDDINKEVYEEYWNDNNQKKNYYKRVFVEDTNEIVSPYDIIEKPTYWIYEDGEFKEKELGESVPSCADLLKTYTSDKDYTAFDVNNEFLKRLAINSKHILRSKGTIDGIEQLMALLGFRSKHWYGGLDADIRARYYNEKTNTNPYDYDINEYTAFATPLQETWDVEHNMYRIDYLNSCKTISYGTDEFMNGVYVPYQGLPVAYRDCDDKWLNPSGGTTTDKTKAVLNASGEPVKARYLYPYFDSKGIYDGNLYYQMKGGWINYSPYSFDSNSNVVPNDEMTNHKETLRDVRQTATLKSLIEIPQSYLNQGTIIYVNDLSRNVAIIDGHIYDLLPEKRGNVTYYYFTIEVKDGSVWLGDNLYDNFIAVSNPDGSDGIVRYCIPAMQEGSILKVYYDEQYSDKFYIKGYTSLSYYHTEWEGDLSYARECESTEPDAYEVYENEIFPNTMVAFINGSYNEDYTNYSHYFVLDDINYYDLIGNDGWRQLSVYDPEYLKIDPIQDNFKGNNPHSGNGGYDSGYAYMEAFKRLFGYALDNEYFNESNFKSLSDMYAELNSYGFSGITEEGLDSYLGKLRVDSKVHGMLNRIGEFEVSDDKLDKTYDYEITYHEGNSSIGPKSGCCLNYDLSDSKSLYYSDGYKSTISSLKGSADSVTSQIMNTKVVELIFYVGLSQSMYRKDIQEKVKYIQDKIMPYVEQMLPSTSIPVVHFVATPFVFDETSKLPRGFWHNEYYFTNNGLWPEDMMSIPMGETALSSLTYDYNNTLYSVAEDVELLIRNSDSVPTKCLVYTFMPDESNDYTISFEFDSNSDLNLDAIYLLDYEYKLEREGDIFTKNGNTFTLNSKHMTKDTHYKIAFAYTIDEHATNVNSRKLNGVIKIITIE